MTTPSPAARQAEAIRELLQWAAQRQQQEDQAQQERAQRARRSRPSR